MVLEGTGGFHFSSLVNIAKPDRLLLLYCLLQIVDCSPLVVIDWVGIRGTRYEAVYGFRGHDSQVEGWITPATQVGGNNITDDAFTFTFTFVVCGLSRCGSGIFKSSWLAGRAWLGLLVQGSDPLRPFFLL